MSKSKKNKAVALKYNIEEDTSPVVIASGYGTVAEKIIDIAEKKGIPVFKDDSAASLLCMLEVGSNIPVDLYEVVAAIYCKLLETSAKIKNEEAISQNGKDPAKSRLRGLARGQNRDPESGEERGRTLLKSRSLGRKEKNGGSGNAGETGKAGENGRGGKAGEAGLEKRSDRRGGTAER